jgi:hypothetical protein
MKRILFTIIFFCSFLSGFPKEGVDAEEPIEIIDNSIVIDRIGNNDIEVTLPSIIFTFKEVDVKLKFLNPNHTKLLLNKGNITFIANGKDLKLEFIDGQASFKHKFDQSKKLTIFTEDFSYSTAVTAYPLWAILVPIGFIIFWIIRRMIKK